MPNSPEAEDAFTRIYDALLPDGIERTQMFGRPALTIDGKIFACLSEGVFGVKLRTDPDAYNAAMQELGSQPFTPGAKGRTFGGWVGFDTAHENAWLPMARIALAAMQRHLAAAG
ncbi:MAG: TfoX/Sxy family protein [Thermomicrobiales bacterium]